MTQGFILARSHARALHDQHMVGVFTDRIVTQCDMTQFIQGVYGDDHQIHGSSIYLQQTQAE